MTLTLVDGVWSLPAPMPGSVGPELLPLPAKPKQASASPHASAITLGIVRYDRRLRRAWITIAPGTLTLRDVVVSVRSRSHALLARRKLKLLDATTELMLRLKSTPPHLVVTVRAQNAVGGPILVHSKV